MRFSVQAPLRPASEASRRFSPTVRLGKMRRSSGTNAIPIWASEKGLLLVMSLPLKPLGAGARGPEPHHRLAGRGAARAVAAQQRDDLTLLDLQRDVLQHVR